jgi:outer membrane lipoprotein-sorting protein
LALTRLPERLEIPVKNVALLCLLLLVLPGRKQNSAPAATQTPAGELQAVLTDMDKTSSSFRTAQADFEWDNYQKVVDETDKQTGKVYFRREGAEAEAMYDITGPGAKQVLFKGSKLTLYNPKINQITEYDLAKRKIDVAAFLSLGFGAPGHDLLKSYEVKMAGWETVDGTKTARLELTALSPKVRSMFSQFVLWIDPVRDVPIKQQVLEPSGDCWLSHYTDFKLGEKIPNDAFHINATGHPSVVKPE